mmetsp:Transcript_22320/g.41838  ORF Transcript_22320/g.41838 Transcript_22320/m.41838 type:complete len:206 (-) Transcript_22320:1335-1952(-)
MDRDAMDLREFCPSWLYEEGPVCFRSSSEFLAGNETLLLPKIEKISEAARYGESIVLIYLDHDIFSAVLAPVVMYAAKVFPDVVFLRLEGQRVGNLLEVLPKYFPLLIHQNPSTRLLNVFDGDHSNVTEVIHFVETSTKQSPLVWEPHRSFPVGSPEASVAFLSPPKVDEPLYMDLYYVLSVTFLVFLLGGKVLGRFRAWLAHTT